MTGVLVVSARAQGAPGMPAISHPVASDLAVERWQGASEPIDAPARLARAADARKRGQWLDAVRLAKIASTQLGTTPAIQEGARRLLRDVVPHLTAPEAMCLSAWFGLDLDLQFQIARALLAAGRPAEAQAQALWLFERDPAGKTAKDALDLIRRSGARRTGDIAPPGLNNVFDVGLLAPLSGDYETYGRSLRAGLELALLEHNARARLPVLLSVFDTEGEGWRAAIWIKDALDRGVGSLVGDVLTVPTLVMAGRANQSGVPLLSPSATDPNVGRTGSYVFQTGVSVPAQGSALARYAIREQHRRNLAVPAETDTGFRSAFEAEAARQGAQVILLPAATGVRDLRAVANELRRARADAVLLPDQPDRAEMWSAALTREQLAIPFLATEAIDPASFHAETRKTLEGMTAVGLDYALPDPAFARVDSLARAYYGLPADRFVRRGYLTGRVIAAALDAGADTPEMLTAAFRRRADSLGFLRYEESEAVLPILAVRRGQLVRVK